LDKQAGKPVFFALQRLQKNFTVIDSLLSAITMEDIGKGMYYPQFDALPVEF
jgi:hypothetical protein